MLGKLIIHFAVLSGLLLPADDLSLIRLRENLLTKAINAKDNRVLSSVTDDNFRIYWTAGSLAKTETMFSADQDRTGWLGDLINVGLDLYEVAISKIIISDHALATVMLQESWTLHSHRGRQIEKHFISTDSWLNEQGTWKLARRDCRLSNPS